MYGEESDGSESGDGSEEQEIRGSEGPTQTLSIPIPRPKLPSTVPTHSEIFSKSNTEAEKMKKLDELEEALMLVFWGESLEIYFEKN